MFDDDGLNNNDNFNEFEEDYEPLNKHKSILLRLTALCILLAFLAFSIPNLPVILSDQFDFIKPSQELDDDEIVLRAKPAITSVEVIQTDKIATRKTAGTGFNISPAGVVLTNQHVVTDAEQVKVSFSDGSIFYSRNFHQIGSTDMAAIRIQGEDLPFIPIVLDEIPEPGETVTVIGNPLGFDRIAQRGAVGNYYKARDDGYVLFDIDIIAKKGNSGSPVINQQGKAAAIVFAVTEIKTNNKTETRALAIPLQLVKSDLEIVLNDI